MPSLEGLWIKWSSVTNITSIQELSRLRYFHLGSSTALRSIHPLAELTRLKWLGLENLKHISAIDPIGTPTQLEGLTLEGSMWNTWKVRTLAPLSSLHNLRYLSLAGLRANDRTLAPLFALRSLERFVAGTWWDDEELREIHRRNPRLAA